MKLPFFFKLIKSCQISDKGLGIGGYLLLYAMTLYDVNMDTEQMEGISQTDLELLRKSRRSLETMYARYAKQKVGWKKGNLQKMEIECKTVI